MHETARAIADCRHPTLAQIHGICVGGGLEIAALCDMRICGESSRFGAPIKNLGLVMAYPEMDPLIRLAGPSVALEILYEGRIFDAHEAKDKRLVNCVVPDDRVAAECRETAQRIADGAPLVARWHKKFARRLASGQPLAGGDDARRHSGPHEGARLSGQIRRHAGPLPAGPLRSSANTRARCWQNSVLRTTKSTH